jgi:bacterioferritin
MSDKVIEALQKLREQELTAIVQYTAQDNEFDVDGYPGFGDKVFEIAQQEMTHAKRLGEQLRFLGGKISVALAKPAEVDLDLTSGFKSNIGLEELAIETYNAGILVCVGAGDNASRAILESILSEEREHLEKFQQIEDHILKLKENYIANQT